MGVIIDEVVGEVAPAETEATRGSEEKGGGAQAQDQEQRVQNFRRDLVRLAIREARLRAD